MQSFYSVIALRLLIASATGRVDERGCPHCRVSGIQAFPGEVSCRFLISNQLRPMGCGCATMNAFIEGIDLFKFLGGNFRSFQKLWHKILGDQNHFRAVCSSCFAMSSIDDYQPFDRISVEISKSMPESIVHYNADCPKTSIRLCRLHQSQIPSSTSSLSASKWQR